MKIFFLTLSLFWLQNLYAQNSLRMKQIDSVVNVITHSELPTQRDSTVQDYPGIGLYMKTYVTIKSFGKELKNYSQVVKTTNQEDNITKHIITGSSFYYSENGLVKVEEFMLQDGKEEKAEWYFANDKCFFYTLKSNKAEARIPVLLNLSKAFLKIFRGKN